MTKKELQKLIEYTSISGGLNNNFCNYSKLYSMTTENIYGFLSKYNLKNKKILTVAGSGDQRLNCYSLGADEVTCFDINLLSHFQLQLKDEAIKHLNYNEFLDFFGIIRDNTNNFLKDDLFDKIKVYLNDDVYGFYNFLINEFRRDPLRNIYYDFDNDLKLIKKINHYINEDNYYDLSHSLNNKQNMFIEANVDNLPEILDGEKFDMILLSNISDYIHYIYSDNNLERYRELIDKLIGNLNLYGIIQVGYIYSRYSKGEDVSKFHFNEIRNKVFPNDIFHSIFVDSYYNDGTYDKVITYQKLK
ncbi:MAG: DUF3419 family protein [Bacilli bacterium]|nr:DUF3419 family protein [Bacilli bacterium]